MSDRPTTTAMDIPVIEKDLDGVCCARVMEAGWMGADHETHHPGALLHSSFESSQKLGAMIYQRVVVLSEADYHHLRSMAGLPELKR